MEELHRVKPPSKGLAKWLLVAACGLLTALLITAGIYYKMDQDLSNTVPVKLNSGTDIKQ